MLSHLSCTFCRTLSAASRTVLLTLSHASLVHSLTLPQASSVQDVTLSHLSLTQFPTSSAACLTQPVTFSHTPENHSVIFPQFLMTRITPAMAAAIAPTMSRMGPSAMSIAPMAAVAAAMTGISAPTTVMMFPTMVTTGPMAATIPPTMRMVFCISGERPDHHSATLLIAFPTVSNAGARASSSVPPTSEPRSFSSFMVVVNLSVSESVSSKV